MGETGGGNYREGGGAFIKPQARKKRYSKLIPRENVVLDTK